METCHKMNGSNVKVKTLNPDEMGREMLLHIRED